MKTLQDLVAELGMEDAGGAPVGGSEVAGAYAADLLSDVMGSALPGELWVTIQSHLNVVAVAALKELAAVVICGGHEVEEQTSAKAAEEGVTLLSSTMSVFEVCGRLWELGVRRASA